MFFFLNMVSANNALSFFYIIKAKYSNMKIHSGNTQLFKNIVLKRMSRVAHMNHTVYYGKQWRNKSSTGGEKGGRKPMTQHYHTGLQNY